MTTLTLFDINAHRHVPHHVEVAIRKLPRQENASNSIYRRLWILLENGATMAQCYRAISSKRPTLEKRRDRLREAIAG